MRLLVIEDDAIIRKFLAVSLKREGFAVDVAEDGEQGSYIARTNEYDLIILDNVLPKKSGPEVCAELRKHSKTTRILVLSVQADAPTKVDLLRLGADDYLAKPFSYEELLERIRAILRRPSAMAYQMVSHGDLVLDVGNQLIVRDGEEIHCNRKEFALLEYLLRNRGMVVSRGMLMEHVWDRNIDPFSNTIETHISSLRRKLDRRNGKKLIHTVPGRGYKIDI
jgi:two-component system, OmpR family, response regulator